MSGLIQFTVVGAVVVLCSECGHREEMDICLGMGWGRPLPRREKASVERGLKEKILGREEKRLPDGGNKKACRHRVGGTPSLCD